MSRLIQVFVGIAILSVFLACAGFAFPLDFAIAMTLGWIWYLGRVVPRVAVDRGGVALGLACLVAFGVGLHAFLRWLAAPRHEEVGTGRPWPARRTAALVSLVVLMFASGIADTGVAHQVGWLLAAREPLDDSSGGAMWRAISTNKLKQIGLGLYNYSEAHSAFPPAATFDAYGSMEHGWMTRLLPYIEHQDLYNKVNFSVPWDDYRNAAPFREIVTGYQHPKIARGSLDRVRSGQRNEDGYATAHYSGNARLLGGSAPISPGAIVDGTSTTILAGEILHQFPPWGYPANWRDPALGVNRLPHGFGGPSPGGMSFLFADGSVRFVKESIDLRILEALSTPAGGELVSPEDY